MTLESAPAVPPLPDVTLSDLRNFALIVQAGGLRRASAQLACNPSSLSRSLRRLERQLAMPLLQRTTRSIALTEPGEALFAGLSPALVGLASALERLDAFRGTPCGRLRIHAPRPAVPLLLNRIVPGFVSKYPEVRLEIRSDDSLVDAVAEGFDAAVRFRADVLPNMVAIPLGLGGRHVVVGTPSRVRALGRLDSPEQLPVDALVAHREVDGQLRPWPFSKDGRELRVTPGGRIIVNEWAAGMQAAVDGLGLARVFEAHASASLRAGRLVSVLDDWCGSSESLHLCYASRRQAPAPLRALINHVLSGAAGRDGVVAESVAL